MSFRYRLALFLVATLAAVQALTAVCAYTYLRASLVDKAKKELVLASGLFTRQLEIVSEGVSSDVEVLSLDYALRQAIAQQDYATELSALRNHGRRVGATRMMLVGLDGAIAADTGSEGDAGRPFAFATLLSDAAMTGERTALANLGGKVYWIVVVPVRAPVAIAFIAACIPVDDALLGKLASLSSVPRSLALATLDAKHRWHILARTAGGPRVIPMQSVERGGGTASVTEPDGSDYLAVSTPLAVAKGSAPVMSVLSYPLSEAFAAYRSIIGPVLLVLALALLAATAGAFFVVRRASRPLEELASTARRVAKGDYTPPPALKQNDEIGQLSQALAVMARSIGEREAALTSAIEALETARAEAVAANEAKSQFLANMSHELRTPLNAIVGFGEMLSQQVLGPLGVPRYVEYARDILSSGQHLLAQVSRILDLADVERGKLTIARYPVDAGEILAQSAAGARAQAEKAGVELVFAGPSQRLPLEGDAAKLRQVFANVLGNAIKFTPEHGRVEIGAVARGETLCVRIADSGTGIRAEDIANVTRPFHRLRSALDGLHQGAGLGLPYANAIVGLHGGTLRIESALGSGTTVEIALPLKYPKTEAAA